MLISLPLFLFADYFLSYNAVIKNSVLISSKLECSKCLTNKTSKKKLLFRLDVDEKNAVKICKKYKNEIIDRLLQYNTIINARYFTNDRIKIVFLPHRFDIIIKNSVAYFYIKGE